MRGRARRGRVALALVLLVGAAADVRAEELEYPVKVEFIERFTRFITWPAESFRGADGPFMLCVLGDTAITPPFERLARERRLKDRRVELRRLRATDDVSACHLLFLAGGERTHLKQVLARASGKPILTVADSEGFAHEGVIINLFLDEEGHVRFEICSPELKKSGLKVSAQLLRLARVVSE
jgi:YfiR/HmsC-like